MNTAWRLISPDPSFASNLSDELKIAPLIAQLLINRGVKSTAEAEIFLKPRLAHLRDPLEIPNIETAARRVLLARERGEKVMVFGDYDVDGVTGTAILVQTLREIGISADYYIPHRYGEGYGLSSEAIKAIAASGVKLIVTVDCGISNSKEIDQANQLGLEVIVTDHHNLPQRLPPAFAVVNPKQIDTEHSSRHLSGAGVAFKFAWMLLRLAGKKDSAFLSSLLDLAALGTLSDVVPLNAENRVLAAAGLNLINERKRLGLRCLLEAASLKGRISVRDIYFGLAPRLNAAGRLEHASKAVELLLTDDPAAAKEMARELGRINSRRQDIGRDIKEEVFSRLDDAHIAANKLILLSGSNWHPGVIGIVASQVVDRFSRPAVLVGVNDGVGRGSARSVDNINIYDLLFACRDLFSDFGGHAGAAGFEIDPAKIPELAERLRQESEKSISPEKLQARIVIDAELAPALITMSLVKELELLDPHGEGNPLPLFLSRRLMLADQKKVGSDGKHLKQRFSCDNFSLNTIGFGLGQLADKLSCGKNYDIVYRLGSNEWDGFESAQLSLVDIREAIA